MKRKQVKPKSQHYSLSWNIFKAVEVVEAFEKKAGHADLPYSVLAQIYEGSLLPALQFEKIKNLQKYGVTFHAKLQTKQGECVVERGFRIDEPMKLSEFINGKADCYVNHGSGIKTKGWRGAKDEWLAMMDEEFKDDLCVDAWAVANCLVRV